MSTQLQGEGGGEMLGDPPFPQSYVVEVLKALSKAIRAHQLYLPNNPMHSRAIEGVREALRALWTQTDSLEIKVVETQFQWDGRTVLDEPDRNTDSLPWIFYKDGIRELKLQPTFEDRDLTTLLDILQKVRKAGADDDDLLTLMWEHEFDALQYRYVDLSSDGDSSMEGVDRSEPRDRIASPEEMERGGAGEEAPMKSSIAKMDDFDSTLYFLDDREIEYLQSEIKRDFTVELRTKVLGSLLDTFEQQTDPTVREEICSLLDYFLLVLLSTTQFRTAAYLLRESAVAAERAVDCLPPQRQRLAELTELLSDASALGQLLQALEDTPLRPPQMELNELFGQLRPKALETLLGWIGRSNNPELRSLLENAATRLSASHTSELVRLIGADDEVVMMEAIRRAGALKTPAAVPALGRLLTVGTPETRLTSVSALTDIGSPGALQVLERAITDEDRDIRVAAVRALGARGAKPALPRIETAIKGKELRETNLSEKMAFFEAFGLLSGEGGVALLDSMLHTKGFMGKKDDTEIRACAAMALGKIASNKAMDSLNRAVGDKDVIVRNAVSRAIRGAPPS